MDIARQEEGNGGEDRSTAQEKEGLEEREPLKFHPEGQVAKEERFRHGKDRRSAQKHTGHGLRDGGGVARRETIGCVLKRGPAGQQRGKDDGAAPTEDRDRKDPSGQRHTARSAARRKAGRPCGGQAEQRKGRLDRVVIHAPYPSDGSEGWNDRDEEGGEKAREATRYSFPEEIGARTGQHAERGLGPGADGLGQVPIEVRSGGNTHERGQEEVVSDLAEQREPERERVREIEERELRVMLDTDPDAAHVSRGVCVVEVERVAVEDAGRVE